jgi:ParB family transcriptional regulator, chromosome partitioning protein
MMAKGLGKDFSALIPEDMLSEALAVGVQDDVVQQIALVDISPDPEQPRKVFDDTALNELAVSIKQHGIVQPLIVTKKGKSHHIIAGERRWRAAQLAGLETAPVIVRSYDQQERLEVALIENIQREDLTVLDLAAAYFKLHNQFNLSYQQISAKVGKSVSAVNNIVRLLKLPLKAKKAIHDGLISEGHGRQIVALTDEAEQLKLLELILKNRWTVRQTEQYVVGHKQQTIEKPDTAVNRTQSETKETKFLAQQLKTPVKVKHMAKGGQLMIRFLDEDHLQKLVDRLGKT